MEKHNKELENQIKQAVADHLGVSLDLVVGSSHFVRDLGADSLDLVELLMALEELFSIDIPDEDAKKIQTVQDAINIVASKQAKQS